MESLSDQYLAASLKAARQSRGWTLDELATRSGVSRAAISKIERADVSPTATVLARLAAGLGVSMASLFSASGGSAGPLSRRDAQMSWTDPQTGYIRRNVSPSGYRSATDIVDVSFPPGARVVFDNATPSRGIEQQVWMLSGTMEITIGEEVTRLEDGDCLFTPLDRPLVFSNPAEVAARYAVVLTRTLP